MAGEDSNFVTYECADRIATISLNRPEKLNAVSDEVVEAFLVEVERHLVDARHVDGGDDGFDGNVRSLMLTITSPHSSRICAV